MKLVAVLVAGLGFLALGCGMDRTGLLVRGDQDGSAPDDGGVSDMTRRDQAPVPPPDMRTDTQPLPPDGPVRPPVDAPPDRFAIVDMGPDRRPAGDAPSCPPLANTGPTVALEPATEPVPASLQPAGGAITDGLYELTRARAYNVPPPAIPVYRGIRVRYTIRISGRATVLDMTAAIDGAGAGTMMVSGLFRLTAMGTSFTSAQVCPRQDPASSVGYTATATELTIKDNDNILTFTLR